uniref:Uncharacterized protein n=1 Tax=Anguilla anguilla TaxID=7936 RepID=A0A0E9W3A5_ANGAN
MQEHRDLQSKQRHVPIGCTGTHKPGLPSFKIN